MDGWTDGWTDGRMDGWIVVDLLGGLVTCSSRTILKQNSLSRAVSPNMSTASWSCDHRLRLTTSTFVLQSYQAVAASTYTVALRMERTLITHSFNVGLLRAQMCIQCQAVKGSTVYNVGLSRVQLWIMLDCQGLNCV